MIRFDDTKMGSVSILFKTPTGVHSISYDEKDFDIISQCASSLPQIISRKKQLESLVCHNKETPKAIILQEYLQKQKGIEKDDTPAPGTEVPQGCREGPVERQKRLEFQIPGDTPPPVVSQPDKVDPLPLLKKIEIHLKPGEQLRQEVSEAICKLERLKRRAGQGQQNQFANYNHN